MRLFFERLLSQFTQQFLFLNAFYPERHYALSDLCINTRDHRGKYTVVSGVDFRGSESIFAVLTLPDGALRVLNRSLRARKRWQAEVALFLANAMKCCEML